MVWMFLVAAQFAFWANIVEPLCAGERSYDLDFGLRQTHAIRLKLAAAIVFFALPGFFLVLRRARFKPGTPRPEDGAREPGRRDRGAHRGRQGSGTCAPPWRPRLGKNGFRRAASALRSSRNIEVVLDLQSSLAAVHHRSGRDGRAGHACQGSASAGDSCNRRQRVRVPAGIRASSGQRTSRASWPWCTSRRTTMLAGRGQPTSSSPSIPSTAPDLDWTDLSSWQSNRKSLEELLQTEGRGGPQPPGQRFDPGAGRHQRHDGTAGNEVTTLARAI